MLRLSRLAVMGCLGMFMAGALVAQDSRQKAPPIGAVPGTSNAGAAKAPNAGPAGAVQALIPMLGSIDPYRPLSAPKWQGERVWFDGHG